MLDKMIEINIKAALRLVRLTVPRMIERGNGGSIINVSSISGLSRSRGGLLYSFTKAGLIMMTAVVGARIWHSMASASMRCAPGLIQTDFSAYFWEDEERRSISERAADRPAGPARRRRPGWRFTWLPRKRRSSRGRCLSWMVVRLLNWSVVKCQLSVVAGRRTVAWDVDEGVRTVRVGRVWRGLLKISMRG